MLNKQRRRILIGGSALLGAGALASVASPKPEPVLEELPGRAPLMKHGKVLVTEFFSFLCPFCARFAGPLDAWAQNVAHEAVLELKHVGLGRSHWQNMGMLFYALEGMGLERPYLPIVYHDLDTKGHKVFEEFGIHWAKQQGLDLAKFQAALKDAPEKLAEADRRMHDYAISSVPALVIGGRYVIRGQATQETFDLATDMVRQVRQDAAQLQNAGTR